MRSWHNPQTGGRTPCLWACIPSSSYFMPNIVLINILGLSVYLNILLFKLFFIFWQLPHLELFICVNVMNTEQVGRSFSCNWSDICIKRPSDLTKALLWGRPGMNNSQIRCCQWVKIVGCWANKLVGATIWVPPLWWGRRCETAHN